MAKRSAQKASPPSSPDVPDLSTPQAVLDRLLAVSAKSSSPETDPAVKSLAKVRPDLLTGTAPQLCTWLRHATPDGEYAGTRAPRRRVIETALRGLLRLKLPFDLKTARPIFDYLLDKPEINHWEDPLLLTVGLAEQLHDDHAPGGLPRQIERCLVKIRDTLAAGFCQRNERKAIERIDALLGRTPELPLKPGDPISDAILADLSAADDEVRTAWSALLHHCRNSVGDAPPKSWLKGLDPLLNPVENEITTRATRWFPLLAASRADGKPARIDASNYETLKGLTWCVGVLVERGRHDPRLAAALQQLAAAAYVKVPAQGRRCPKVGDAAVAALARFPLDVAAARLSAVQRQCRNPMTDQTINAALDALAQRAGIPRDQLEELTIPTFGLSPDGTKCIGLGPVTATLDISTGSAEVTYTNDKGKTLKTLPAAVKRDHADAIAALKQDVKDLDKLLASQRDRLDALLGAPRTWPLATFRQLYLDHPLVGRVARRLIWTVGTTPALYRDDHFEDVAGHPVTATDDTPISPWHPIHSPVDLVASWRRRLEDLQITQPFKQAHREIYLLTDAERTTRNYSNRFAAHLIRQAQFRALATARGWEVGYIGGWDNGDATPTRDLPHHNLRIEFWVDAAPVEDGSLPGGGALYLTTDQVRFYRTGSSEPLALSDVPPLPFTEAMRDVDLFVGVCSVGNDPTWQDHTADPHHRAYWHNYSFGDLSASAQTRRDVLSRLLPRLRIADRCTLTDRFLHVRGHLASYKIHLGSSNILIDPNDRYLCIVPDRSPRTADQPLFLPFEGDSTLAVILSKAFLLADDKSITDPTITRQIKPE